MKLISVVGARPQFIKLTPFINKIRDFNLQKKSNINSVILHTGQHYNDELSKIFFDDLKIPKPDFNLNVGSASHGEQTGKMLTEIEKILISEKPNLIVVFGDTNSTLAGALAAAKLNIPVVHIEAGLRSFNRSMPEEINRIMTDHVSELLFAPTKTAILNLEKEGLKKKSYLTGDIMYDSVLFFSKVAGEKSTVLSNLDLKDSGYIVATIHRAENTDNNSNLKNILHSLNKISERLKVIFPIHPRTSVKISKEFPEWKASPDLKVIEPVGYLDMLQLLKNSRLVITDSGGLQKEAFFLNKPCITLRNETEWVETLEMNANYLAGTDYENIAQHLNKILDKENSYDFSNAISKYFGNGNSAAIMLNEILKYNNN